MCTGCLFIWRCVFVFMSREMKEKLINGEVVDSETVLAAVRAHQPSSTSAERGVFDIY